VLNWVSQKTYPIIKHHVMKTYCGVEVYKGISKNFRTE
jgi:hypothetical protein